MSGGIYSLPSLTVTQAYAVDKKIDGFPQSGNIRTQYLNTYFSASTTVYAINLASGHELGTVGTGSTSASQYTCYDNGGVAGATQQYSVEISNGNGVNCALSFQMQAGD